MPESGKSDEGMCVFAPITLVYVPESGKSDEGMCVFAPITHLRA